MAQATIVTKNHANVDTTFTLASTRATGALYKMTSRSLSQPFTIEFKFLLGAPGAKGNDRLAIICSNTLLDAVGVAQTATCKMEISVPRSAVFASPVPEDMLMHVATILAGSGGGNIANREALIDGVVV